MLKFSFLLIILANLVFLLWEFQQGAFSKKGYPANDKTVNHEILLIDEAPVQTIAQHDQAALKENSLALKTDSNAIDSEKKPVALAKTDSHPNTLAQQSKIKQDNTETLDLSLTQPAQTILAASESPLETTENTKNRSNQARKTPAPFLK